MLRARVALAFLCVGTLAWLSSPSVLAAPLYSEDFDADHAPNWAVNNGPSTNASNFFFDYNTVGIPAAPNSSGGSTRGLKLEANVSGNINGGISVSPLSQNFSGDYVLAFDYWGNFQGPFPGGGNGTTQLGTYGIGTAGSSAQWPSGTHDSVWFAACLDGASSADYRAYSSAAPGSYGDGNAAYSATTRNNTNAYYAPLGSGSAPASQLALFPNQTGTTSVAAAGMRWRRIEIKKVGATATWTVDGLQLATVNLGAVTLGGGNFFLGHADTNATSSTDAIARTLLFSLYDNVTVTAIPEPTSWGLAVIAAVAWARRRR